MEAVGTNLTITNVPVNEVFSIKELGEFDIKLHNGCGIGDVIDFEKWVDRNRKID